MLQRILLILVIVAVVVGGGFYAYQQLVPPPAEEATGPTYATQPVIRGDVSAGVETSGPLNPSRGGSLQVPGFFDGTAGSIQYMIEEILAEEGDPVQEGQVILRLQAPGLEQDLENKRKALEAKQKELSDLLNVSVDQLTGVDPIGGITLRAPIDGRVIELTAQEGKALEQGAIAAKVVDDSHFRIVARLSPGEFKGIEVGQKAAFKFPQYDGLMNGTVIEVNPNAVPESRADLFTDCSDPQAVGSSNQYELVYWVTVEGEASGLIQPGMRAQVGFLPVDYEGEATDSGAWRDISWGYYCQKVEGFGEEERILSPIEAIPSRVYVQNMQNVSAGDPILSLAGDDARQKIADELEKLRQLETEYEQLLQQGNQLEVKAPMTGVIAYLEADKSRQLRPGEYIGSVYNTENMRMWVQIDDVDILLVRQGAPVRVTVDALPNQSFEGEVMNVSTMGTDERGIARFSVDIEVVGSSELRPGMQAKAYIDAGSAEDVLLVPVEAIFEEDGQTKVEILNPDGSPKVVTIELGLMNDRYAEVKSGVEEGDLVITGSSADLLPSQTIQGDGLLPGDGDDGGDDGGDGGDGGNGGGPAVPVE